MEGERARLFDESKMATGCTQNVTVLAWDLSHPDSL
jgi:hypothetical protein